MSALDIAAAMAAALDHALRYANQGMPVFPIWPVREFKPGHFTCICKKGLRCGPNSGKHPLSTEVRHGLIDASLDETKIRGWFGNWPEANIGIVLGKDLVVIDIDPRHGGDVAFAELEAKQGRLPPTWRVRTGGGGIHIYLKPPAGATISNSAGLIGKGIDVRADGGYVVAPPSTHISGRRYEWDQDSGELAPMPDWILEKLAKTGGAGKAAAPIETWQQLVRNGLIDGQRNDMVTRFAGHLLRRRIDLHVVLELLLAFNEARGKPPLEADVITGIVHRVGKLELKRRRAAS